MRKLLFLIALLAVASACTTTSEVGGEDADETTTTTSTDAQTPTTVDLSPDTDDAEAVAAFCDSLEQLRDIPPVAVHTTEEIDQIEAVIEDAPPEFVDGLEELVRLGRELEGRDVSDPAVLAEAEEQVTPELLEFGAAATRFTQEQCGFGVPILALLAGAGSNPPVEVLEDALTSSQPELAERIAGVFTLPIYVMEVDGLASGDEAVQVCTTVVEELADLGATGASLRVTDQAGQVLAESTPAGTCAVP